MQRPVFLPECKVTMFQKIAIVGVGLLGGSIGLAARERKLAKEVVGVETNPHTRAEATTRKAVAKCTDMLGIGIAGADLVILACPVQAIVTELARLAPSLSERAVVTDVGSVKTAIAGAGQVLGGAFVPGHPMAGGERGGMEFARADLFEGAHWALTPDSRTRPDALVKVTQLVEGLGARVVITTPEEHDRSVAATSHLPHLLAYALSATAGESPRLEGPSFKEATRVASSDPELWREICLMNRKALGDALDRCIGELDGMLKALDAEDGVALEALLRKGWRR
jgi:prephenate dehydrogenase